MPQGEPRDPTGAKPSSLASYERYRARLKADPEARENFLMAQSRRLILREERSFFEVVDGVFELPAKLP